VLKRFQDFMKRWLARSRAADRERVREMVDGHDPLLYATAVSVAGVAVGSHGTLVLTAEHLHYVAPASQSWDWPPLGKWQRLDLPLVDIKSATEDEGALDERAALVAPALRILDVKMRSGLGYRFRVYRQEEWASAIEGVRREALLHRLDRRFDTLSGTDVDLKQPTE
jgi:hypothetical protein